MKGRCGERLDYDESGRLCLVWFLDENNNLFARSEKYAGIAYQYDEDSGSAKTYYINADGERAS